MTISTTASTRRAVVRTGAWAVPAIAAAATAPAYASVSQPCCVSLVGVASACRRRGCHEPHHGASVPAGYTVSLQFDACECTTIAVVAWDMTGTPAESVSPTTVELARGRSTHTFTVRESGVPATSLKLSYSVDGHVRTETVPLGRVGRCAPEAGS